MTLIRVIIYTQWRGYVNVSRISLYIYICLFVNLFSSVLALSSFLFCVLYIRVRVLYEKNTTDVYGIVSLTSYVPRIVVSPFLQFVFVITNNKTKYCRRNVYVLSSSILIFITLNCPYFIAFFQIFL